MLAPVPPFVGVVRKAEHEQSVVDPHDAEADLPGLLRRFLDLRYRIDVFVDDGVEEPDRHTGGVRERFLVESPPAYAGGEVDAPEDAALVGEERLLSAGVCRVDLTEVRGGVVPVDLVVKEDARLAVLPDPVDDAGPDPADRDRYARSGVGDPDFVLPALRDEVHERIVHHHGDVEVGEVPLILFCGDERQDIGVPDVEDPHVRPAAAAPLLDHVGCRVEDPHERDRPRCNPVGRPDRRALRPDAGEVVARSAAGLVDDRPLFHGIEYAFDGVRDRQGEAGGELPEFGSGVHEGG